MADKGYAKVGAADAKSGCNPVVGLVIGLVVACGAFGGGYYLGKSGTAADESSEQTVLLPETAEMQLKEALRHMSNVTAADISSKSLRGEMKHLKKVHTDMETELSSESSESIKKIKALLKEKHYDAKAVCATLQLAGSCAKDLAEELKKDPVHQANCFFQEFGSVLFVYILYLKP